MSPHLLLSHLHNNTPKATPPLAGSRLGATPDSQARFLSPGRTWRGLAFLASRRFSVPAAAHLSLLHPAAPRPCNYWSWLKPSCKRVHLRNMLVCVHAHVFVCVCVCVCGQIGMKMGVRPSFRAAASAGFSAKDPSCRWLTEAPPTRYALIPFKCPPTPPYFLFVLFFSTTSYTHPTLDLKKQKKKWKEKRGKYCLYTSGLDISALHCYLTTISPSHRSRTVRKFYGRK